MSGRWVFALSEEESDAFDAALEEGKRRYDLAMDRLERFKYRPSVSEEDLDLCVVLDTNGLFARLRVRRDDLEALGLQIEVGPEGR